MSFVDFASLLAKFLSVKKNPQFTQSSREPGSGIERITNDLLEQGNIELFEFSDLDQFVRDAGCQ